MTRSDLPVNDNLGENVKVSNNMSWENESLAPNRNKIVEFAMVGGMDYSYVNPKFLRKCGIIKLNKKDQCGKK